MKRTTWYQKDVNFGEIRPVVIKKKMKIWKVYRYTGVRTDNTQISIQLTLANKTLMERLRFEFLFNTHQFFVNDYKMFICVNIVCIKQCSLTVFFSSAIYGYFQLTLHIRLHHVCNTWLVGCIFFDVSLPKHHIHVEVSQFQVKGCRI